MVNCIFCDIVVRKAPAYVVYEDKDTLAFLDKYPQSPGQIQLIPKQHYQWIYEIPDMGIFFDCAQELIRVIIPILGADHVTMATFGHQVKHAHLWIVPQYAGSFIREDQGKSQSNLQEVADMLRKNLTKGV